MFQKRHFWSAALRELLLADPVDVSPAVISLPVWMRTACEALPCSALVTQLQVSSHWGFPFRLGFGEKALEPSLLLPAVFLGEILQSRCCTPPFCTVLQD